ncbi:ABC transporter permease [Phenylobacterium sp.]|uniref:ABC transporter permease n=1 Tax=Phenylobacterium sp. TaxID=1871053 RepID=UPI0025DE0BC0|nr:ABC transporter permease subunit [Phenylobacterium sp.]MBX3483417.1 ABC transporter permease subunit [Phenylobacterium sp.]MCW5759368.1 ABC transporter permease subunit [Phenylobacterium sp.]
MAGFLLRRLGVAIPTLLAVITLSFFMMHAAPGSPFASARKLPPEVERNMRARYGLDLPVGEQYLRYLGGAVRGDLGPSLKYPGKSVSKIIGQGLPTSLKLGVAALVCGTVLGVALGVAAALRRRREADHLATVAVLAGLGLPSFVTAPLLVLVFAAWLGWLPTAGLAGPESLILPVAVLTLPLLASVSRLTRAGMAEALRSNAVRTARAQGLSRTTVVLRYALPQATLPLVSILGPAAAGLLTGSLVVEQLFGLPGVGKAFVLSALQRDYTVVLGVVILYAALILVLNLLADLLYAALDPRVKLA